MTKFKDMSNRKKVAAVTSTVVGGLILFFLSGFFGSLFSDHVNQRVMKHEIIELQDTVKQNRFQLSTQEVSIVAIKGKLDAIDERTKRTEEGVEFIKRHLIQNP